MPYVRYLHFKSLIYLYHCLHWANCGDQILNAASFEKLGYSIVIQEEEVTNEKLLAAVNEAFDNKEKYIAAMNKSQLNNSIEKIVGLINSAAK